MSANPEKMSAKAYWARLAELEAKRDELGTKYREAVKAYEDLRVLKRNLPWHAFHEFVKGEEEKLSKIYFPFHEAHLAVQEFVKAQGKGRRTPKKA